MANAILERFDLSGKTAAVTGGGGDLCGHMVEALGAMGAKVAVLDIRLEKAEARAQSVSSSGAVTMRSVAGGGRRIF
jgi:NAD(P)-dependent dehydrogenase (short-subunit alcohol dehydrogenase family)